MVAATLSVRIGASITDFERKMSKTEKIVARAADTIAQTGAAMSAAITLPLAAASAAFVKLAADAEETASKFEAVFGRGRGDMDAWIRSVQSSIPATRQELRGMTAEIQDLLVPMGVAPQLATKMTQQITTLAGDLGSFNNIPMGEALERIRSGLVGQYEPLLKFGVALNASAVKAEALRLGLHQGTGELNPAVKAYVGLQMVLERTAAAQGDAARTADSAMNTFRFLRTEATELGTELGQIMIPAVVTVASKLRNMVEGFRAASPEVKKIVVGLGGVAAVAGPALLAFGLITAAVIRLKAQLITLSGTTALAGLGSLLGPAGAVLIGVGLLTAYFIKQGEATRKAREEIERLKGSLSTMPLAQLQEQRRGIGNQIAAKQAELTTYRNPSSLAAVGTSKARDAAIARLEAEIEVLTRQSQAYSVQIGRTLAISPATQLTGTGLPTSGSAARDWTALDHTAGASRWNMATTRMSERDLDPLRTAFDAMAAALARILPPQGGQPAPSTMGTGQRVAARAGQTLGNLGGAVKDSLKDVGSSLMSSFGPMAIAFAVLGPTLQALQEPLQMIGQIFATSLGPVIQALMPIIQQLGIVISYVVEIILKAAAFLTRGIGAVVRGLGRLVNLLPGSPGDPLVRAGQAMLDLADGFSRGAREIAAGRDAIRGMGEQAAATTEALRNIPAGYKVALARFNAMDARVATTPYTPSGPGMPGVPAPRVGDRKNAGSSVVIDLSGAQFFGVSDVKEFFRQLERVARDEGQRGGTTTFALTGGLA